MATQVLLNSELTARFRLSHVDLADRRGIDHVDKPDVYDVLLFLKQWGQLFFLLLRERPAVVYLAISQSTVGFIRDSCFIFPSWLLRANVVVHLHGGNFRTWYESRSWLMKWYVRTTLARVAHAIVLGECLRNIFAGLIPLQRVTPIPNGIPWSPEVRASKSQSTNRRLRILYLSTLNQLKGALVLLEAIPLVLARRQDVEFVLAGPWSHAEDKEEANRLMACHNLWQHVTFTGPITDAEHKRALYESADLFVFPGVQQEGQPLVVLEAMAAGLPVLYTNRGCLRETVIDGETGVEVRLRDSQHLAEKILWLVEHPLEIERMGMNARNRFQAFYTIGRFVNNMMGVFDRAVQGG